MKATRPTSKLSAAQVLDNYFLEHRAKLLDLAAFLDRLDRGAGSPAAARDHRLVAMRKGIAVLLKHKGNRAQRILDAMSDPTSKPIAAAQTKGATGAYAKPSGRRKA